MARFIATLQSGMQAQTATPQFLDVAGVTDAQPAQSINAVIVSADPGARRRIAALDFVEDVFEDIQAVPQVAGQEERESFFREIKEIRGQENVPPQIEIAPLRRGDTTDDDATTDDEVRTDGGGGAVTIPQLDADEQFPETLAGPIENATASVRFGGAAALHEQGDRGSGVTVVGVDTGVCGEQIADGRKREGVDLTKQDDPWTDYNGHGSMSMGIFAGGEETTGIGSGFAPEADVLPIKTTLAASEIIQAQDIIIELAEQGATVVVNNSWGFTSCEGICDHPVTRAVDTAAKTPGVTQVFAAGNNAGKCGGACDGSNVGINGPNSLTSVITVAASGQDGDPRRLQSYSSRGGPEPNCGERKPDVAAPVFGRMPWDCGARDLGNGGGTSAAAPQVAGAVALVLAANGARGPRDAVADALEGTAVQWRGAGWNGCSGHGNVMVDEAAAAFEAAGDGVAERVDRQTAGVAAAGLSAGVLGAALREFVRPPGR